jgi:hypothetical protein
MTEAETKQKVMDFLTTLWTHVQNRQAVYFANKGKYCQGLELFTVYPADGSDVAPDRLATKPTDQQERWGDVFTVPATMPCSVRLDVYQSLAGWGFVLTATVQAGLKTFRRSQNSGPETWRQTGWVEV